jgi:hypothetical protein
MHLAVLCVLQVPLELIEWQPVFHQVGATGLSGGQWSANWRVSIFMKMYRSLRYCGWQGMQCAWVSVVECWLLPCFDHSALAASAALSARASAWFVLRLHGRLAQLIRESLSAHAVWSKHQPLKVTRSTKVLQQLRLLSWCQHTADWHS